MDKTTLLAYMPKYYSTSKVIDNINNTNANELTKFQSKLSSTLNQFFIESADFTLERWEKEFGLEVNNNLDINFRRSRIKAILRGQGTVTKPMLQNLLKSMPYGDAEIIEYPASSTFKIIFNNYYSIPTNITEILKTVDTIKPAHLDYSVTFAYSWWDCSTVKLQTWGNAGTWDNFRTYKPHGNE